MNQQITSVYHADLYLRLSKSDGDKAESDSIANQRIFIKEFLKTHPEIQIHAIRIDDGYTGTNFNRPAFQQMLEDIKQGSVNCVIVKDLSRFGRNYIEVGKYLEKLFPYLGVRFIAINDQVDSKDKSDSTSEIIIPFKNLINDSYSRDNSIKIRTDLSVKRRRGNFVGAFAPYGYRKAKDDKNKLVIDETAAYIIKDIFSQYVKGHSIYKIAENLNQRGVLSPMEYKRFNGSYFYTGFRRKVESGWSHTTVQRILKNPVYAGDLVQGKYTTPNYKVKRKVRKEEQKWDYVEHTHEPVISKELYKNVQELLQKDTKAAVGAEGVYSLAGLVKCADCGCNMSRKTVPSGKRKYVYYVCGNHKYHRICSSHSINVHQLEQCVLQLFNHHIQRVMDRDNSVI